VLKGDLAVLVPVTEEHVPELRRIRRSPEVRVYWGNVDDEPDWPLEDPTSVCFAVLVDDQVRGMIQYGEEEDPDYRHASLDIFLDPAVHGRGVGADAVRTLARYLIEEHGHHRLVIDPSADNAAAIRCYAKVGFRPVGIMRRYERDHGDPGGDGTGWHDGLLMDLLAEELE
jgi:aminoglycoside 6'-N-acetyltransferase